MDDETRRDLRRRRLCFTCQEPWAPRHKCTKGKAHFIEVFSDSEPKEEETEIVEESRDEGGPLGAGGPPPPPHEGGLFSPVEGFLA